MMGRCPRIESIRMTVSAYPIRKTRATNLQTTKGKGNLPNKNIDKEASSWEWTLKSTRMNLT